jgi:hypothetical protein
MTELCPVCQGKGIVPRGFYRIPLGQETFSDSSTSPEQCKRCVGVGTIND